MNEADSLWLEKIFEGCGYTRAGSLEEADVFLINSCSVRQAAEDKVYGLAPKISELRITRQKLTHLGGQAHNAFCVILTGCMVGSAMGERQRIKLSDLKKRMPWADYFVSPDDIFERLPEILFQESENPARQGGDEAVESGAEGAQGGTKTSGVSPRFLLSDIVVSVETQHIASLRELVKPGAVVFKRKDGKEAYVPVMRGCDHFCSYCAVPYGRGKERSRPMKEVIAEVEELVEQGVKKITLLGQNVNSYGKEFKSDMDTHFCHSDPPLAEKNLFLDKGSFADAQDDGLNKSCGVHPFAELLRRLHGIAGLESIWFLTSNPWDFSDDLINTLALPKIEKYLHLPVQSGDDGVLKRMNRPYTAEEYKGLVKKIRKQVPGIQLGTDLTATRDLVSSA